MNTVVIWFGNNPKIKALCFSMLWLTLLLFFTYTPLVSALVHADMNFFTVYTNMQCHTIAMVVNFGLVFMLVVDAWGVNMSQDVWQQVLNYLSFFLVIGIYWHSKECINDELGNLSCLLKWSHLAFAMHLVLIMLLLVSKTYSVYKSSVEDVDKTSYEF